MNCTVAVVGCGQWGAKVVSCFARLGVLVAVVDADAEQAGRVAASHDVPALDWDTVLSDESIAAVALASPAKYHAAMILEALHAGKHVYVEKPLALSSSDAERVEAAVLETGKTLLVGHILQYHPGFLALKAQVQEGKLGKLLSIRSTRFGPGRIRHDENSLWCLAPHDVSMILGLIGQEPTSVEAHASTLLQADIEDSVDARLTFPGGVVAEIAVSWIHPYKERNIVVIGDQSTLVFDDGRPWDSKLMLYPNKMVWENGCPNLVEGTPQPVSIEQREPLLEQGRHFIECIRTGARPVTDVREGASVVRVLGAVTEAIRGSLSPNASRPASVSAQSENVSPADSVIDLKLQSDKAPTVKTESTTPTVALLDLKTQQELIKPSLDRRIAKVLLQGQYIMGEEVAELEQELSLFSGGAHVIACASGTDALTLAFLALDLRPGDAVLVPAFTFVGTIEPLVILGAIPIFVDVDAETLCIDPALIEKGIEAAKAAGRRAVGIVAVDLYGHPAKHDEIEAVASQAGLWVVADAAQSFGASVSGDRSVGSLAKLTTTSFFPAKPLGCYGDGGAIFTTDSGLAHKLRSIHQHGKGEHKYDHVRVGMNSRLDTLQAAVLLSKLEVFPNELDSRQQIASRYGDLLEGVVRLPQQGAGVRSAWATYTIRSQHRDALHEYLSGKGVMTAIHYPKPLHQQTPYQHFPTLQGGCPVAEQAAAEVLSLPMHPYLKEEELQRVAEAVQGFCSEKRAEVW